LIGRRVRVHLGAASVVTFDGRAEVARHERLIATGGQSQQPPIRRLESERPIDPHPAGRFCSVVAAAAGVRKADGGDGFAVVTCVVAQPKGQPQRPARHRSGVPGARSRGVVSAAGGVGGGGEPGDPEDFGDPTGFGLPARSCSGGFGFGVPADRVEPGRPSARQRGSRAEPRVSRNRI